MAAFTALAPPIPFAYWNRPIAPSGAGPALKQLLASFTGGTPLNVSTDNRGFYFMPQVNMTVYKLGRIKNASNSQHHTVALYIESGCSLLGSVDVDLSTGSVGDHIFNTLVTPISLTAATRYYLVSSETSGGDNWLYDAVPTFVNPSEVSGTGSAQIIGGSCAVVDGGDMHGPVDMQYTTP